KDHSLVEELRRQGRLTEKEAEEHPQRSVITRALGPEERVKVDTMTNAGRDGDISLLCSDGLTTMVDEEQIRQILEDSKTLKTAVSKLISAANDAGGRDNITALAFRLADEDSEDDDGATLIASTAEQAGLTADRVRAAARRMRPGREPARPPHSAGRRGRGGRARRAAPGRDARLDPAGLDQARRDRRGGPRRAPARLRRR